MFRHHSGPHIVLPFKKTDTTVRFSFGGVFNIGAAGNMVVVANDSTDQLMAVCQRDIALSDSVDAVPAIMCDENTLWFADMDSDGGAADTDVGKYFSVDTNDTVNVNASLDISDATIPHFLITKRVSATLVLGRFARTALRTPAGDALDS